MAAVIGGGFLLGHGDHLGAFCMQHIPPGLAFPLYAGTALLLGSLLNLVQARASPRHLYTLRRHGAEHGLAEPECTLGNGCTGHTLSVGAQRMRCMLHGCIFVHRSDTRLA